MRIAVIGNSHVASLKTGWDSVGEKFPGIELHFYASRGTGIESLVCVDGVLQATLPRVTQDFLFTSGLAGEIAMANYDAFLVYGLQLVVSRLSGELSSAVRNAVWRGIAGRSNNDRVVRLIRSGSDAPIVVGANPQPAASAEGSKPLAAGLPYAQAFRELRPVIEMDEVTLFLEQPAQTLADGWHTRPEYSAGSTRLDVGDRISGKPHPSDDVAHMNGAFGEIMLVEAFRRLEPFHHQSITATASTSIK